MIIQEYGKHILICDICEDTRIPFDSFGEAVDYKKPNGWKIRKVDNEWKDVCPECAQNE